jgi:hypothetical protein
MFKGSKFKRVVVLSSVGDNFKGSFFKTLKMKIHVHVYYSIPSNINTEFVPRTVV